MHRFIVRYNAQSTGVLRTETVAAEDALAAMAQVKRRLGASRTFQEARVFEEGALLFNVMGGGE